MKGNLSKFWPILLIVFINFVFFSRLFYPETRLFTTPDFGLSDILHFNYPLRFTLADSLENGKLPLWTNGIGGGFPLFATGQTGAGNIIVFLTSLLFPPAIGFNLTYLFAYLLMGISTYLFARLWDLTKTAALFAAIVFSFSGVNITHFAHTDHLLTVSFVPLVFFTLEQALRKNSRRWWIFFAFAGSQCLLAGNANAFVYGFFAAGVYFGWRLFLIGKGVKGIKGIKDIIVKFGLAGLILFGLSAFQLLPSLELTLSSQRGKTGWAETAQQVFPYPPKHLLTFINPYLLGDPHKASYPMYGEDWGLFWENTAYIGVIPLLLAILAVAFCLCSCAFCLCSCAFCLCSCAPLARLMGGRSARGGFSARSCKKDQEKQYHVLFFGFLAIFTLLLSLGKYTPLFIILKLPPLNLFRIPSTFLFVTDFALAMLAGYGLQVIQKKLSLFPLLTLFTLSVLDLMAFGYNYNPIGKAEDWQVPPQVVEFLKKDTEELRIFSPLSAFYWNKVFENRGWQDGASEYLTFKNMLASDVNLLWNIPSIQFYSGVAPERTIYAQSLLIDTFQVVDHAGQKELLITDSTSRMLNLSAVKYVVTPGIINHPDFKLVLSTNLPQEPNYNIYENLKVWPRARVVCGYETASTIETTGVKLLASDFNPQTKVLLEQKISFQPKETSCSSKASIVKSENDLVELDVKMKDDGILLLADSFYPGWEALVDGKRQEILPANINQRAVTLLKGEHKVEFVYDPTIFKVGLFLTVLSLSGILGIWIYEKRTS